MKRYMICLISISCISSYCFSQKDSSFRVNVYGFIKLNFTYDFRDLGKSDQFKPSLIPVPGVQDDNFFMSAKQTRVGIKVSKETSLGTIKGVIEGDFHNTASDAGGLFKLRHAYVSVKGLTVGMTWSYMFDVETNPNTVDYEGPPSSTLSRVPQIRYEYKRKNHVWGISIENPRLDVSLQPNGSIELKNQRFPDLIASYRYQSENGSSIKLAALGREVLYNELPAKDTKRLLGYGMGVFVNWKFFGHDNVKFQLLRGTGIAAYIEDLSGLGYDAIEDTAGKLESLPVTGGFIAYQHEWSHLFNSTIVFGGLQTDDNQALASTDYKRGRYAAINLFYTPVSSLDFGIEFLIGQRKNQDLQVGYAERVQAAAVFKF
jgi:DcaP outer membrane protein